MKIGVIHANISAVEPIEAAFLSADSDIEVVNFIDPDMLRMVDEAGEVSPAALRRYGRAVFDAADAGVDGILIACSCFSTYVEEVKPFLSIPILPVDGPALELVADRGGKVGILATTAASAPACRIKLDKLCAQRGITMEYEDGISTEALAALKRGDGAKHDQLLVAEARRLYNLNCNTLFLSQSTMARAKAAMGDLAAITITTPEEGVKELLRLIRENTRE